MEKSRLPYGVGRSGRSDLGGEQTCGPEHEGMTAASKYSSVLKSLYGTLLSADLVLTGEGRCLAGRNGYVHRKGGRGRGPSTQGKMRRDNVGKVLLTSRGWSKRQRPSHEPPCPVAGRQQDWHIRP